MPDRTRMAMNFGRLGNGVLLALVLAGPAQAQSTGNTYINPPSLAKPNGYTHVVVAADRRTVYIAGQVAFDSAGKLVGGSDFSAQAEQVFANLRRALASVNASLADVVKSTTFITDAKHVPALREVRNRHLDPRAPPANTLLVVSALARPELLIEIEAIAVLRSPWPSIHRNLAD
jgi:enamine deaminase RidA (YjgF/YER057c/UK114 family)